MLVHIKQFKSDDSALKVKKLSNSLISDILKNYWIFWGLFYDGPLHWKSMVSRI